MFDTSNTTFKELPAIGQFDVEMDLEYKLMEEFASWFDGFSNCPIGVHNDQSFEMRTYPAKTVEHISDLLNDLQKHGKLVLYYIVSMPIEGSEKVYAIRLAIIQ